MKHRKSENKALYLLKLIISHCSHRYITNYLLYTFTELITFLSCNFLCITFIKVFYLSFSVIRICSYIIVLWLIFMCKEGPHTVRSTTMMTLRTQMVSKFSFHFHWLQEIFYLLFLIYTYYTKNT